MKTRYLLPIIFSCTLVFPCGLLFAESPADRVTSTHITVMGTIYYNNRAAIKYGPDGTGIFMWNIEDKGLYFMEIDSDMEPDPSTTRHLPEQYFLDFVIPDSDHITILLQKREGLERYDNASWDTHGQFIETYNTLQLVKVDRHGKEQFRTRIAGHEGIEYDSRFICHMAGGGNLGFDGLAYTVYSEICGNWGTEQIPDVHETDLFVQLDSSGREVSGTRDNLGASHSYLTRLSVPGRGEVYTATIGDGNPYGLQIRGYRNGRNVFTAVPFPDQNRLPYSDMYGAVESATDAGEIGNVLKIGNSIITVMATVATEYHPILEQSKDLLFVKLDTRGTTHQLDWIDQTDRLNETMPYIMPYGGNILLVYYYPTEEDYNNGNAIMAVIDEDGRYVENPVETDYRVNGHSRFFTFPNGDIGWTYSVAYTDTVFIYRVSRQPGGDFDNYDADESAFWVESNTFYAGDPVVVHYSGLEDNDWFTLVPFGREDAYYDEDFWSFADDNREGEYLFYPSEGVYELRLYRNWPDNGYTVDKRMLIEVTAPEE